MLAACGSSGAAPDSGDATPLPPPGAAAAAAEPSPAARPTPAEDAASGAPAVEEVPQTLDPLREREKSLIVIEPADPGELDQSQDLASAARRERERRKVANEPAIRIDQKNLSTWAAQGVLTQTADEVDPTPEEAAAETAAERAAIEEAYWRRRGREIRQRWRDAHDRIGELEAKVAALRTKFYATDDGYLRDTQVKPDWDKAIADLEEARYADSRGAAEVIAYLEEGRRAGALPGWLRDGSELEPEPVVEEANEEEVRSDQARELEAGDPVIYRQPESETGQDDSSDEPPPSSDGRSATGR